MKSQFLGMLVAAGVWCAEAACFPCGTYVIAGGVKNSANELFKADEGIRLQAVSADGAILAESDLFGPYGEGAYNFRLQVPLSTTATPKTAAVGDTVNLVLKIGDELNLNANPVPIVRANGLTNLFVQVVDVVAYTNATSTEIAYIARDYLDTIAPWLGYVGKKTYDPWEDWDGDGSFNYKEYQNGTNPFDPLDYLRITDAKMTAAGHFAISFEYVGGHVYGFAATPTLTKPAWAAKSVKTSETGVEQAQVAFAGTDEESDIATVYVTPGRTNEFFTVEGK